MRDIARDIATAASAVEELPLWASREEALCQVARGWAAIDPSAAAARASRLSDAAERQAVFHHVCIAIAATDPARALELSGQDPALRGQFAQASNRQKARIEKRIAEVEADLAARHAKLKEAGRLAREALSAGESRPVSESVLV